jgi:hypothetical protein
MDRKNAVSRRLENYSLVNQSLCNYQTILALKPVLTNSIFLSEAIYLLHGKILYKNEKENFLKDYCNVL